MSTVILKNASNSDVRINDLSGMRIAANDEYEATRTRPVSELKASSDLKALLDSGAVVWNQDGDDFTATDAQKVSAEDQLGILDEIIMRSETTGDTWRFYSDKKGKLKSKIHTKATDLAKAQSKLKKQVDAKKAELFNSDYVYDNDTFEGDEDSNHQK